jgi:hypothetical protein
LKDLFYWKLRSVAADATANAQLPAFATSRCGRLTLSSIVEVTKQEAGKIKKKKTAAINLLREGLS